MTVTVYVRARYRTLSGMPFPEGPIDFPRLLSAAQQEFAARGWRPVGKPRLTFRQVEVYATTSEAGAMRAGSAITVAAVECDDIDLVR